MSTTGRILHQAFGYDALVWLLTRGRERRFREMLLTLARLQPGESVLDIGCGTGSLAIAARRTVGPSGSVHGIDASPQMVARANRKAHKAGADVTFERANAESLPFVDSRFDAVLSTLMLHHLPREARARCAAEVWRVLKAGGRIVAIDFARSSNKRGLIGHLHRHGHTKPEDTVTLLADAQFRIAERGAVGVHDLYFVIGMKP